MKNYTKTVFNASQATTTSPAFVATLSTADVDESSLTLYRIICTVGGYFDDVSQSSTLVWAVQHDSQTTVANVPDPSAVSPSSVDTNAKYGFIETVNQLTSALGVAPRGNFKVDTKMRRKIDRTNQVSVLVRDTGGDGGALKSLIVQFFYKA